VKVESTGRPDGARVGDAMMFHRLHSGHDLVSLDFESSTDLAALNRIIDSADVVLESSRPRALRQLGISAENFVALRPGRTWVSITGYGRSEESYNLVAFGDDAAVAAGLVAYDDGRPVFCADAIADPLTGLYATIAALGSMSNGGGHLVDVTLRGSAAFANSGASCPAAHTVESCGDHWRVRHGSRWSNVPLPRPPRVAEHVSMTPRRVEQILDEPLNLAFP
jgi:crotonobetainyl-CoA:carnitine CoA-transferase CaiB-like acyl-CoA transferase